MSAAQVETFSPRNIAVLGGLLLIALILGEGVFNPRGDDASMSNTDNSMEAIAMRIKPVVTLDNMRNSMNAASAAGDTASKSPEQLYQGACQACHATGAAGAPKTGDSGAWSERISRGLDALLSAAINGVGAMPPRGGSQYNDEQMRVVVEYIVTKSE